MRAARIAGWPRDLLLALLGLGVLAISWPALSALRQGHREFFFYLAFGQALLALVAARLVWQAPPSRATLLIVLGAAAVLRLGILFEPPRLSDDIYRYVWDGRVQAAGINPYRYLPVDLHLAALRDEAIYPHINRRTYALTIYPPMAQMIFRAVQQGTGSVTGFKACLLLFEAITIGSVMHLLASFGLPRARVLVYAWNPLVLWEFSGNGHIDAAMIAFVALALVARKAERNTLTGILLGAATLTKFFPLALFPALYRRWDWKMPIAFAATCLAGYLPYLGVGRRVLGFLSIYADEEGMRTGRYFPLLLARFVFGNREIPAGIYIGIASLLLAALAARAVWKWNEARGGFLFSAGVLAFAFTFFLSPQFAWYWTWLAPFLAFLPWPALVPGFLFVALALVHYGRWFEGGLWRVHPHLPLSLAQLLPAGLAALALFLLGRKRPRETASEGDSAGPTSSRPTAPAEQA
ncbi:MAG: glycosyltransferase 87 family protein [Chthoniobacterales bacterium]